jgi:hypothetical protein
MIDAVTPISVVSNYTKTTDKEVELHRFISINDGVPKHFVKYILYDSNGNLIENNESSIDLKA